MLKGCMLTCYVIFIFEHYLNTKSDLETKRLKDELDRQQQRLREFITENCKKIQEEKMQVELKYRQEIEMLNSNINVEMDSLTRTRLELERMKRIELELKRELQLKTQTMEDLRQENLIRLGKLYGISGRSY